MDNLAERVDKCPLNRGGGGGSLSIACVQLGL